MAGQERDGAMRGERGGGGKRVAAEGAEGGGQIEEQGQVLVETREEREVHREAKVGLRATLTETRRQASAALVEQRAHMEQTTCDLARRDAMALGERSTLLTLLTAAADRVEKRDRSGNLVTRALSFGRAPKKKAAAGDSSGGKSAAEEKAEKGKKEADAAYELWWNVLTEATAPRDEGVAAEVDHVPIALGDEWVKLADAHTGAVVATVPLAKPVADDSDEGQREALSRAKERLAKEFAHLATVLQRLPEHLAWHGNQCNAAAHQALQIHDEEGMRLRTLQAREFFQQAGEAATEPRERGRQLISAANMTRRLDVEATALQRHGELGLWPPLLGQEATQAGA